MSADALKASFLCLCADGRDALGLLRGREDVRARMAALGLDPGGLVAEVEAALDVAWPAHQAAGRAHARVRGAWAEAHLVAAEGFAWLSRLRRALAWVMRDDPERDEAASQVRGLIRVHAARLRGVTLCLRAVLGELRAQGEALAGVPVLDVALAGAGALLTRLEAAGADTGREEAARRRRVREASEARVPLEAALRRLRRAWAWVSAESERRIGRLTFPSCAAEIGRRVARRAKARADQGAAQVTGGPEDVAEGDAASVPAEGGAVDGDAPGTAPCGEVDGAATDPSPSPVPPPGG